MEPKKDAPLDVAIVGGPTDDGRGHRVLRIRENDASVGELRPVEEGKALAPSTEVVNLSQREGAPQNVFDVRSIHGGESAAPPPSKGPAKVSSDAYRTGWDQLFGDKSLVKKPKSELN